MDRHDTVGIDCVAMCVNDVVCCGAAPLFFLDYIACGKNVPERIADIVSGVAEGCVQSGAALIGGETAEMPGFYGEDEYDLAGFAVGIVDRAKILDNTSMRPGDAVIAIPLERRTLNGFSLVRRVFDLEHGALERRYDELGCTLGETLLTPTRIYVKPALAMIRAAKVRALSHITGGGFYETSRARYRGASAHASRRRSSAPRRYLRYSRARGRYRAGYVQHLQHGRRHVRRRRGGDADAALAALCENGAADAYICGEIAEGAEGGVELW